MESGDGKNLFRTLVGQLASILTLVMSEVRDLKNVTDVLQIVISDPDFASKLLGEAQKTTQKVIKKFLVFVGTITVPVLIETWNALTRFKKDLSDEALVKISDVGGNFTAWFGNMIVGTHTGSTLSYHTLSKNRYDRDIIAELGGEAKVEVSLAEVWWLMEQQAKGGNGALLNDGKANIFYVRDCNGVLRALYVDWLDLGWYVSAIELVISFWDERGRVFVRSPRFESEAVEAGNSMQP